MEFIKKLLYGPKSPTHDWPPHDGRAMKVDLSEGTINGVGLGAPLEDFRFLGPDDNRRAAGLGEFEYYSLGVNLCNDNGPAVTSFDVVLTDPMRPEYQPFAGQILAFGNSIDPSGLTCEAAINRFGEPYWRDDDEDEDEVLLFYEFPGLEWQLEFFEHGALAYITVLQQPVMADPEMRKLYKVDKPWPPEFG